MMTNSNNNVKERNSADVGIRRRAAPSAFGIGQLTRHNLQMLMTVLKATHSDSFLDSLSIDIVEDIAYSRLGYIGEMMVGGILCHVKKDNDRKILHILAISVLKPYEHLGIAGELLSYVANRANSDGFYSVNHNCPADDDSVLFFLEYGFEKVDGTIIDSSQSWNLECKFPWKYAETAAGADDYDVTKHNLCAPKANK